MMPTTTSDANGELAAPAPSPSAPNPGPIVGYLPQVTIAWCVVFVALGWMFRGYHGYALAYAVSWLGHVFLVATMAGWCLFHTRSVRLVHVCALLVGGGAWPTAISFGYQPLIVRFESNRAAFEREAQRERTSPTPRGRGPNSDVAHWVAATPRSLVREWAGQPHGPACLTDVASAGPDDDVVTTTHMALSWGAIGAHFEYLRVFDPVFERCMMSTTHRFFGKHVAPIGNHWYLVVR